MSWSDPARRFEPAEDVALRSELKDLLGLAEVEPSAAAPAPELAELAETLRREAERRRHATLRPRASWKLATAAALPILLGAAGFGWGAQQKHRADGLAAQVADRDARIRVIATENEASKLELATARAEKDDVQQKLVQVASKLSPRDRQPYLVIPVKKPAGAEVMDTLRVKAPGQ